MTRVPLRTLVSKLVDKWSAEMLKKAYEGDADAMFKAAELGMLKSGWGKIRQDVALSRMWMEAAASKGHAAAVMILRHQKRVDARKRMEEEAYYKLAEASAARPEISVPTAEQLKGLGLAQRRAEADKRMRSRLVEELIMPTSESTRILDLPPPEHAKRKADAGAAGEATSAARAASSERPSSGAKAGGAPAASNVQKQIDAQREISRIVRERARQREADSQARGGAAPPSEENKDGEVMTPATIGSGLKPGVGLGAGAARAAGRVSAEEFVRKAGELRSRASRGQEMGRFSALQEEMMRMQERMPNASERSVRGNPRDGNR